MSSFYCEHTAEYLLVPELQCILNKNFKIVSPIYFWKTREGNNLSKSLHQNEKIRILAFFPRRPKKEIPSDNFISGKINHSLFNYSNFARSKGVPVTAGLPITRSLRELANCNEFIWLKFKKDYSSDLQFSLDINTKEVTFSEEQNAIEVIDETDFNQLITNKTKLYSWQEAINFMSDAREFTTKEGGFFWFGGHYKPIYFLIFTPKIK